MTYDSLVETIALGTSLSSRNESGDASLHNRIEPDTRLDSIRDLLDCIIGKGGNFEILLDATGCLRGRQGCRSSFDSPGQQNLRRGLLNLLSDTDDDGILQQLGLAAMAQGSESLQDDALRFAIIQKIPFRQIGVGFDVNDRRLNRRAV